MARYVIVNSEWNRPLTVDTLEELTKFFETDECDQVVDIIDGTYLETWDPQVWKPLEPVPKDWLALEADAG